MCVICFKVIYEVLGTKQEISIIRFFAVVLIME